jgi:hypothetical protein
MTRHVGRSGSASFVPGRRVVLVWALVMLLGTTLAVGHSGGRAQASGSAPTQKVCPVKPQPGHFTCFARRRTDIRKRSAVEGVLPQVIDPQQGYGPSDIQSAYNIPVDQGAGATVAIIDSFDDPDAESDLATYRTNYGLTACGSGCFRKVGQTGGKLPSADISGWATEIMLDLDMVSAACPLCHILLVEADDDSVGNLAIAANWAAAQPGVRAVSNSYGGPESAGDSTTGATYFAHPNVAMVAAAGDGGYGVEFPAASPYTIAVGGTSLQACGGNTGKGCINSQRLWNETVWNDLSTGQGATGSGCSAYEPKPAWQHDSCASRTVADVSAVADPNPGVAIYDTWGSVESNSTDNPWNVLGGTSAAAPIIAAMIAEANVSHPSASYAYVAANSTGMNNITSGTNSPTSCTPTYLCTAGVGYNGPTGQGTPYGLLALGGSGTTPYPLNVGACPSGNVLTNPGFESGSKGWTVSSGVIGAHKGSASPHGGKDSAWLDGNGKTTTDTLLQKVGFSAACRYATVSFWLKINTKETSSTAKHDTMVVTLGAAPIGTWSNTQHSRYAKYLHVTVRVNLPLDTYNAYTGGTLRFVGKENSSKQTSFIIDDVSVTLS